MQASMKDMTGVAEGCLTVKVPRWALWGTSKDSTRPGLVPRVASVTIILPLKKFTVLGTTRPTESSTALPM